MPRLLMAPKGDRSVASSRYRIHDIAGELVLLGWDVRALAPSVLGTGRAAALRGDLRLALAGADVLLVQRPGRRREERLVLEVSRRRSRVLCLDVDDPAEERGTFGWALRHADLAVVGSRALSGHYARRGLPTLHLPTGLDVEAYVAARASRPARAQGEPLVVGFVGHGPAYREPLLRLVRTVAAASSPGSVRLRIVGTKAEPELERSLRAAAGALRLELVDELRWNDEAAVAAEVAGFDVGLVPFRDVEGGSFKCTQYLAAGVVPLVEGGGEAAAELREAFAERAPVVAPGDVAATTEVLVHLTDPSRRDAAVREGLDLARRRFDRRALARRLDGELRARLAGRP